MECPEVLGRPHRSVAILAAVLLVPGLAACTAKRARTPKPPASVSVGLLAATSGERAAASRPAVQGAELAIDIVNNAHPTLPLPFAPSAGLRHGTKLTLAVGDSKGDAAAAGAAVSQFTGGSRPVAVVVADSAEVVKAAGQHTEEASLPLVDACSSADALGELGRQWYFRVGPTDHMQLATAFDALRQSLPGGVEVATRKAVVLDGASGQALGGAPDLVDFARSHGFTIAARLPYNPGTTLTELADKIGAQKPDAVVALAGVEQEATFVNDLAQKLKGNLPVVALGHGVTALSAASGGRGVLRTVGWSPEYAARNPTAHAVDELFQKKYGVPMNDAAASAFMAVLTVAVAVDAAGGVDPLRVRAALRQVSLQATQTIAPWNGVQFTLAGQNWLADAVVEQRVGNGYQVVFPREMAPKSSP
jgi:branched-chain amino acid transport system substrate-binding protein